MAFLAKQRQNSPSNVNLNLVNLVSKILENIPQNILILKSNPCIEIFKRYSIYIELLFCGKVIVGRIAPKDSREIVSST